METSMIVEKNCLYNRYFYYVNELPSKGKWIVEYTVDYEEVELLKKPIAIEKLEILNHDDIDWYDDSGNKSSNVEHQYNIDDYTFYKITYECVCLSDELNDEIESYVETMYVYTDVYIKHDVCRFENAIKDIANEIKNLYKLENDHYYDNYCSSRVFDIEESIEFKSKNYLLTTQEYKYYLEDIRDCFDQAAKRYLDNYEN